MLADAAIRAAKPATKPYRLTDGAGLFVHIMPNGSKLRRMRYKFSGKETLLAFGRYPSVSLVEARDRRHDAKQLLRDGRDPGLERQRLEAEAASATSFEAIARDWHSRRKYAWTDRHALDVLVTLERDVFPAFGRLPINEITPPMVLGLLRVIEARPAVETARRVRQRMSAIFVYAIASGIASADPAADVKGALAPLVRQRGRPVQQGLRLPDRLRQADLADSPGATTRSIITILNSWRAAGLVVYDTDRALLTVRDVAALRAIISTEH